MVSINEEKAKLSPDGNEQKVAVQGRKYFFWHLFATKKLTAFSIVMGVNWFTAACISYGLNFNIKNLFGSPQLILAAFGLFGWLFMILALILDRNFSIVGRKFIHLYSMTGPFLCFVAVAVYLGVTGAPPGSKLATGMTILVIIGDSINQGVWLTCYQLSAELFPTVVRNMAGGFCSSMARIGSVLAPYLGDLGSIWMPLPYTVLAFLTGLSLLLSALFLEETKGKALPEKIEDVK